MKVQFIVRGETRMLDNCFHRCLRFARMMRLHLAVVVVLVLTTACFSAAALAAEGDVCEIGTTAYATLDDALAAVQSGENIRLLENINYNGGIIIEDKNITFDLNGFTLNVVNTTVGEAVYSSGLYVKGNATVDLTGTGELNVTGSQYGVYVEGGAAGNAAATVTNAAATGPDGCAAYANGENAVITVEGDVTAASTGGIGAKGNSSGLVTVKGNVAATAADSDYEYDYDCAAVEAWDNGEVIVEGDVIATGNKSIGVLAAGSSVTVGGDVTGVLGGAYASVSSSIEITGNVSSTDASGFGVQAIDNCAIDVGGNVGSSGTGVMITGTEGPDGPSEITIDGVITAPVYIQIGSGTLNFEDYDLDPGTIEGYRIYANDSGLGAVYVLNFASGNGSEENPYLIATADQLNNVRNYLDKHFKLIAHIELSSFTNSGGWEPIGDYSTRFTGTIEGGEVGYTISSLFIDRSSTDYVGMFGCTGAGAEIRDLGLTDVNVTGRDYVGGLVGRNYGLVTDSYVTGNVIGDTDVGGLVGQNEGSIIDSYFAGTVTADYYYTGGLVGDNIGTITNCHTEATVTCSDNYVGGLAGGSSGPITDSYATGTVTGADYVGGLVGWNFSGDGYKGEITDSYSTCTVEGMGWDVGGLVGDNSGPIASSFATGMVTSVDVCVGGLVGSNYSLITNSYATGDVEGENAVGGLVGYNNASITNCYAIGAAKGEIGKEDVGGLVGDNGSSQSRTATNSYWDTVTSGLITSDGGEGKTTAEMKQQATFTDWDFDTIWRINDSDNNGYPFLSWQGNEGGQTNEPPVLSAVGVSAVTQTTATLNFTSDKVGNYYFLVYSAEDSVPDAATIKAQGEAAAKGTGTAAAAANAAQVTGLTASTAYKAYVVVEDTEENISNVAVISFTTLEATQNNAPNRKTGVPAASSASITVNTAYTLDLSTVFEDADSDPLTYTVSVDGANQVAAAANYIYTPASAGDTILVFKANDGTVDSTDTYTVTLTANAVPPQTYALTITAGTGGSITTGSNGNYAAGTVISIAATPSSGYSFNKWSSVGGGTFGNTTSASTNFTMPANAVTITADFMYNGSGGGGGGGYIPPGTIIDSKAGGSAGSGGATVIIGSNVLPADARFNVTRLSDSVVDDIVPEGLLVSLGSNIYEITTSGTRNFEDQTITIRIAYDPAKIAAGEQPVIRYLDETTEQWIDLPTTLEQGADGQWNAVTRINHLTKFAVFSARVRDAAQKVITLTIGQVQASVNGSPYALDAVPFVDKQANRTLVPVRFISEAIGAEVDWNAKDRTITIQDDDKAIVLTLGSKNALVDGETTVIDCAPVVLPPGRTFVPLRFVSENLGANVNYAETTGEISITR